MNFYKLSLVVMISANNKKEAITLTKNLQNLTNVVVDLIVKDIWPVTSGGIPPSKPLKKERKKEKKV